MSEENKPFSVKDRRHFTTEGALREEAVPEAGTPVVAEPASAESAASQPGPDDGPVDFEGFLVSLGVQAGALLGEAAQKGEGTSEALAGARSLISILEMLQNKTEGNRTPAEERVLESLLYELRMGYVATARAATT